MRKFLALVLALVMTMSLVTVSAGAATDFTDDAKIVNTEAVEVLNAIGVLGGYPDGSFRPEATLTRGAGAKLLAYLMLGQEKADNLKATYTVFEDVDDTVVLAPYIEWAAANGIVGGYGDGNFGPYNTLTEYAFGKMLLGAVGYDAAKQGYVGNGWQTRVFRDAVNKDIFNGTEGGAACTRDTAARMALATLEANYVAYGSHDINGWYEINGQWFEVVDPEWAITVNGAFDLPVFVWQTYGDLIFDDTAADVWGNPGDEWTYEDELVGFYEDEFVVSYTEQVDYCDLLVDLGVAVNSSSKVDLGIIYDGVVNGDGDFVASLVDELGHEKTHYHCDEAFLGAQGVLTKVFATELDEDFDNDDNDADKSADYIVTEVAYYLAEVTAVEENHAGTTAYLTAYDHDLDAFGQTKEERDLHDDDAFDADPIEDLELVTDKYAEGDMVLVTIANETIVTHELAKNSVGKLTGYKTAAQASPAVGHTTIDSAKTKDAFGFVLGYDDVKTTPANELGDKYTFYFDTYGNVIGAVAVQDLTQYTVIDAIWHTHNDGDYEVKSDLVSLTADWTKKAVVATLDDIAAADYDEDTQITEDKDDDLMYVTKTLYTYEVNAKGAYELTEVDEGEGLGEKMLYTDVTFEKGDFEMAYDTAVTADKDIELNNKTQILILNAAGEYEAVTGYKALAALSAAEAEVIFNVYTDENGDKHVGDEAAIVFLKDVVFAGDVVLGYVANSAQTEAVTIEGETYYVYTVYVDGKAREIYVVEEARDYIVTNEEGLYEFKFATVGGKLVVKETGVEALDDSTDVKFFTEDTIAYNGSDKENKCSFENYGNVALDDVAIYVVDQGDHTVEAGSWKNLVNDLGAELVEDEDGNLVAIYVLWTNYEV